MRLGLGIAIGTPGIGHNGGPGFDAGAQSYFDAVALAGTTLDAAHKTVINNLFVALRGFGLLAIEDDWWMFGNQDATSSRKSHVLLTNATPMNNPTHTPDRGYGGNGSSSYVASGQTPGTTGTKFTQNSGFIWVYSRTNIQANYGAYMGFNNRSLIIPRDTINAANGGVNTSTFPTVAPGLVTDSRGLFAINRSASGAQQYYRNGVLIGSNTSASNANARNELLFLCDNAGSPGGFSAVEIFAGGYGASHDATQVANHYTAWQAAATALGANV